MVSLRKFAAAATSSGVTLPSRSLQRNQHIDDQKNQFVQSVGMCRSSMLVCATHYVIQNKT